MSPGPPAEFDPHRGGFAIRRIRETDLTAYRDLRLRALLEDPLAFGSTWAVEADYPTARWVDRVRRGSLSETEATWVAEGPGAKLSGMIVGVRRPDGKVGVFGMWVESRHRRLGVGGRLLDALLAWADQAEPRGAVVLSMNPTQTAALHLYLGRGFRPTGGVEPLGHSAPAVVHEMERPISEQRSTRIA